MWETEMEVTWKLEKLGQWEGRTRGDRNGCDER